MFIIHSHLLDIITKMIIRQLSFHSSCTLNLQFNALGTIHTPAKKTIDFTITAQLLPLFKKRTTSSFLIDISYVNFPEAN